MDVLRPTNWDEYIGQTRIKEELDIRIRSASIDDRPLDHCLLVGPPGAGKTSLAQIMAHKLDDCLEVLTMPVRLGVLIRTIQGFGGVLLLDEIHRASPKEQEELLPLLEFGYIQDTSGRQIETDWLTIVGATTEPDKLIEPLVDRFPIKPEWAPYTDEEMTKIVLSMGRKAGMQIIPEHAEAFGVAATGTPRKARQFVLGFRDLCNSLGNPPSVEQVLHLCRTASDGLTTKHLRYLDTLYSLGGTKGLNVICSLTRETPGTIQDLERLLVDKGYLTYSERGRELTGLGMRRAKEERGEIRGRR